MPSAEDWHGAAEAGAARTARVVGLPQIKVSLPDSVREEIIAWAITSRPNEACGLIAGDSPPRDGGKAIRFIAMANAAASPYRYMLDPEEQLLVMTEIEDRDEVVWGIVHSHVSSAAEPSATDIGLAYYPDSVYLICSLATDPPHIRAWTIHGRPREVPLYSEDAQGGG